MGLSSLEQVGVFHSDSSANERWVLIIISPYETKPGTKYSSPRHMSCHDERDSFLKTSSVSVLPTSKLTKGNKDQILVSGLDEVKQRQVASAAVLGSALLC